MTLRHDARDHRSGPDLAVEQELFAQGYAGVIGMDEVGRGALAGPVMVGATWASPEIVLAVDGLTDSKALSDARRRSMVSEILGWVTAATGSASPREIDELGIIQALRLAGMRALDALAARVGERTILASAVLLDGRDDWLTRTRDLFAEMEPDVLRDYRAGGPLWDLPVRTEIKGDFRCATISAASVVAKVERDDLMISWAETHPAYGWERNKGYGAEIHRLGIERWGPCPEHRLSWSLGATEDQVARARSQRAS